MARIRPPRRWTRQPSTPQPVDLTNPLSRGLLLASYAGDAPYFTDMVTMRMLADFYGTSPSFYGVNHTKWGRGRFTGGGGNRASINFNDRSNRGQGTAIIIVRPRINLAAGVSSGVLISGDSSGWDVVNVGLGPEGKFKGNHPSGSTLLSDEVYTLGETYIVGYSNNCLVPPYSQRLYVDGKRQIQEAASSAVGSKYHLSATVSATSTRDAVDLVAFFVWNRPLSDLDHARFAADPYQLFNQRGLVLRVAPPNAGYRALVLVNGRLTEVTDAMIGTSLKPVVFLNGRLRTRLRVFDEGQPVVLVNGVLHTLPEGNNLII